LIHKGLTIIDTDLGGENRFQLAKGGHQGHHWPSRYPLKKGGCSSYLSIKLFGYREKEKQGGPQIFSQGNWAGERFAKRGSLLAKGWEFPGGKFGFSQGRGNSPLSLWGMPL